MKFATELRPFSIEVCPLFEKNKVFMPLDQLSRKISFHAVACALIGVILLLLAGTEIAARGEADQFLENHGTLLSKVQKLYAGKYSAIILVMALADLVVAGRVMFLLWRIPCDRSPSSTTEAGA